MEFRYTLLVPVIVSAMPLNIHTLLRPLTKNWRRRRFELFLKAMQPKRSDILLDVGGYPDFWAAQPQPVARIDSLNLHRLSWDARPFPNHNIQTLIGDGCAIAMPDKSYDIGFSNSVIEHVCTWERQQEFAAEIRRVARDLWVQTPAYACPIEPHYMTPFVHYLPRSVQKVILRWGTVWGWVERPDAGKIKAMLETIRLLRKSEMRALFPDCEIMTERMLWVIPKSYIAIRRGEVKM